MTVRWFEISCVTNAKKECEIRLGTYPCRVGRFHSFAGDKPGGSGGDESFS